MLGTCEDIGKSIGNSRITNYQPKIDEHQAGTLEIPWDSFTSWLHQAALSGTLAETLRSLREADDLEFCMGGNGD